jgi:large subunit ribosomal protein L10
MLIGGYRVALKLDAKQAIVADVAKFAGKSILVIAAEYRGLTVGQMTALRSKAREAGVHAQVVRNTLARRAFENTDFACMSEVLVGPMILLFAPEDPGVAARLVRDFMKQNEVFKVKALSMDGQLLEAKALQAVADLPTREQAISLLMSVMLAPIVKLVRTLVEPHAQMVRAFAAVSDQKQAA